VRLHTWCTLAQYSDRQLNVAAEAAFPIPVKQDVGHNGGKNKFPDRVGNRTPVLQSIVLLR
jgi:hypothetical protein